MFEGAFCRRCSSRSARERSARSPPPGRFRPRTSRSIRRGGSARPILFTAVQPLTQLRKISRGETLLQTGRGSGRRKDSAGSASSSSATSAAPITACSRPTPALAALPRCPDAARRARAGRGAIRRQEVALPADHLAVRTERARTERERGGARNLQATLTERINLLIGRDLFTPFAVTPLAAPTLDERSVSKPPWPPPRRRVRRCARRSSTRAGPRPISNCTRSTACPTQRRASACCASPMSTCCRSSVAAASLVLTWQPFDWGRRGHETNARGVTLEQARIGVVEAQAQVELDVRSKARAVAEAHAALGVAQLGRDTAAERLRVTTDRYQVEASLLKDVLEAQTAMAQASPALSTGTRRVLDRPRGLRSGRGRSAMTPPHRPLLALLAAPRSPAAARGRRSPRCPRRCGSRRSTRPASPARRAIPPRCCRPRTSIWRSRCRATSPRSRRSRTARDGSAPVQEGDRVTRGQQLARLRAERLRCQGRSGAIAAGRSRGGAHPGEAGASIARRGSTTARA